VIAESGQEPKVLPVGEPTGNLDEDTRDEIITLLDTMWQERGLTMVFVTHDSTVARRAQLIGVMKNGRFTFKNPARPVPARSQAPDLSSTAELSPSDLDSDIASYPGTD
jgi:ABC-type lipoprotein export system ATPase subunit